MPAREFFDVLSISDENGNVDMIQALMGNDCLGTYFNNGIAKLYFYSGLKNNLKARLQEINSNHSFQWKWEKQNKENWHLTWQKNFQPVIIEKKLANKLFGYSIFYLFMIFASILIDRII